MNRNLIKISSKKCNSNQSFLIQRIVNRSTTPINLSILFFQIVATDRDLGFNGALLFVISEGDVDSAFSLDAVTGDLAVAGFLDRERTPDYILNVTVYDQGLPQKSASKLIRVAVDDMNDNRPRFVKSTFSFFFPENTSPGTPVITLNATGTGHVPTG